jgi:hypothetical protein
VDGILRLEAERYVLCLVTEEAYLHQRLMFFITMGRSFSRLYTLTSCEQNSEECGDAECQTSDHLVSIASLCGV